MTTISSDGEIVCVKCKHVWHDNCYFEMGAGSQTECPSCGAHLVCTEVEVTRTWHWDVDGTISEQ